MFATDVTPPPGFELERGEHLAIQPLPGSEFEEGMAGKSVQLPPGFELEKPAAPAQTSLATASQAATNLNVVQRQTNLRASAQAKSTNAFPATGIGSSGMASRSGHSHVAIGVARNPPSASWRSTHQPYKDSSGQLHTISSDKSDEQIYREATTRPGALSSAIKTAGRWLSRNLLRRKNWKRARVLEATATSNGGWTR